MDDLNKILENIDSIRKALGLGAAIVCLIILLAIFFLWYYLKRKIEKSAEISYEKLIKEFQSDLDKEFQEFSIRLSHKYQNQTKAIEEIYGEFVVLTSYLDLLNKGDKYEDQTNPFEQYKILLRLRKNFINVFELRKIYIPKSINLKIAELIPTLNVFIDTYKSGLILSDSGIEISDSDNNEKFIIAGIWNQNKFNKTILDFKSIQNELEQLFRSITND